MIKYSNGVDTTIRHTLYLKLFRLLGIYRSNGLAPIVKSIQDFCKKKKFIYRVIIKKKTIHRKKMNFT